MRIGQTEEQGYTVYKFTNRGVDFEVLTSDGKEYQVWCTRAGTRTPPAVYGSLEELAKRSKTFTNFTALIAV